MRALYDVKKRSFTYQNIHNDEYFSQNKLIFVGVTPMPKAAALGRLCRPFLALARYVRLTTIFDDNLLRDREGFFTML